MAVAIHAGATHPRLGTPAFPSTCVSTGASGLGTGGQGGGLIAAIYTEVSARSTKMDSFQSPGHPRSPSTGSSPRSVLYLGRGKKSVRASSSRSLTTTSMP